jgi:hypothetical protein
MSLADLLRSSRSLDRIADALERIANVAEGKFVPLAVSPEDEASAAITYVDDRRMAAAYEIETRLRRQLNRDPEPEEILRELDGLTAREEIPPDDVSPLPFVRR